MRALVLSFLLLVASTFLLGLNYYWSWPETITFSPPACYCGEKFFIQKIKVCDWGDFEITIDGWTFLAHCHLSHKISSSKIAEIIRSSDGATVTLLERVHNKRWSVEIDLIIDKQKVNLTDWIREHIIQVDSEERIGTDG